MFGLRECVNSDEIAEKLSPNKPEAASIRASRIMLERMNELLDRRVDFGVETTLATRSLLRVIEDAKSLGYVVILIYFWLNSPDLAVERVQKRVASGGHNVSEPTVRRRYVQGLINLMERYIPVVDSWMIFDNSSTPAVLIAEGGIEKLTKIQTAPLYNKILEITSDNNS